MLQRLRKRADLSVHLQEGPADVNMLPLMNIIMLLIPFLILSTQFIKVGAIDVSAPPIQRPSPLPKEPVAKKDLNLTISVSRSGFTVMTRAGKLGGDCRMGQPAAARPTIPRHLGKQNVLALQKCLHKIKLAHPTAERVVVMAEPEIEYQTIIRVMDASRTTPDEKPMFPVVALSAGVL